MLQYIHEGQQGKERCLLQARNTVFWAKMTYAVQDHNQSLVLLKNFHLSHGTHWQDIFYWKRVDFLIVADVFSKYFLVRK